MVAEGRDEKGRFVKGWKGGTGNPHAAQVAKLRAALFAIPGLDDAIRQVFVKQALKAVEERDTRAARFVFEYLIGKPIEIDLMDRLDRIEEMLDSSPRWTEGGNGDRAAMIREILADIEAET